MTELNHTTETDPSRGDAQVTWPAELGDTAGNADSRDPAVGALLDRLGQLPELPVARHEEVYADLHDELLAALNESVAGQETAGQNPAQHMTSTGDATNEQA